MNLLYNNKNINYNLYSRIIDIHNHNVWKPIHNINNFYTFYNLNNYVNFSNFYSIVEFLTNVFNNGLYLEDCICIYHSNQSYNTVLLLNKFFHNLKWILIGNNSSGFESKYIKFWSDDIYNQNKLNKLINSPNFIKCNNQKLNILYISDLTDDSYINKQFHIIKLINPRFSMIKFHMDSTDNIDFYNGTIYPSIYNNNFNIILSDYPSKLDIINYNTLIITGILNFYNYCVRGYNNLYLNEFNNVQRLIYGLRNDYESISEYLIIKEYILKYKREDDFMITNKTAIKMSLIRCYYTDYKNNISPTSNLLNSMNRFFKNNFNEWINFFIVCENDAIHILNNFVEYYSNLQNGLFKFNKRNQNNIDLFLKDQTNCIFDELKMNDVLITSIINYFRKYAINNEYTILLNLINKIYNLGFSNMYVDIDII